jgi:hypothetical protein
MQPIWETLPCPGAVSFPNLWTGTLTSGLGLHHSTEQRADLPSPAMSHPHHHIRAAQPFLTTVLSVLPVLRPQVSIHEHFNLAVRYASVLPPMSP